MKAHVGECRDYLQTFCMSRPDDYPYHASNYHTFLVLHLDYLRKKLDVAKKSKTVSYVDDTVDLLQYRLSNETIIVRINLPKFTANAHMQFYKRYAAKSTIEKTNSDLVRFIDSDSTVNVVLSLGDEEHNLVAYIKVFDMNADTVGSNLPFQLKLRWRLHLVDWNFDMIVSNYALESLIGLAEMGHPFILKLPIGSVHNDDNDLKRKASENDRENPKKRCVGNL